MAGRHGQADFGDHVDGVPREEEAGAAVGDCRGVGRPLGRAGAAPRGEDLGHGRDAGGGEGGEHGHGAVRGAPVGNPRGEVVGGGGRGGARDREDVEVLARGEVVGRKPPVGLDRVEAVVRLERGEAGEVGAEETADGEDLVAVVGRLEKPIAEEAVDGVFLRVVQVEAPGAALVVDEERVLVVLWRQVGEMPLVGLSSAGLIQPSSRN